MGEALKVRAGMAAMAAAAILAFLALAAAPGAKAATVGGPVEVDFNHVGVNVGALGQSINTLILSPALPEPAGSLPPLELRGSYTSAAGAFTVPEEGGLVFPPLSLDVSGVQLDGSLGLEENATGTFNEATGAMTLNAKIALTIGVEQEGPIAGLPIPGITGPLACKIAPLSVYFTSGGGWPAPGDPFATDGSFTEGALAGAFRQKPGVTVVPGKGSQSTCNIIGGVLSSVGGIWLANRSSALTEMPASTASAPTACTASQVVNEVGECVAPPPPPRAILGGLAFASSKAAAKRGKTVSVTVRVRNTGNLAGTATVALSSSNSKAVSVPKTVTIKNIQPGKTGSAIVKLKAGKKKGSATITAKFGSSSAKASVSVK